MGVENMFLRMESMREVMSGWGGEEEKHRSMFLLA